MAAERVRPESPGPDEPLEVGHVLPQAEECEDLILELETGDAVGADDRPEQHS
jgi:hypothetical protein